MRLIASFDIKLVILSAEQDDQPVSSSKIIICTDYGAFSIGNGTFTQLAVDRTNTKRWELSAWSYTTYAGTIYG